MKKIKLHWQILIALVLAVLIGYFLPQYVKYLSWMGDMFMRALKMLIVPLILSSIITSVANIGSGANLGRLGLKSLSFYFTTTTLAILTGLFFVNLIEPGVGINVNFAEDISEIGLSKDSFSKVLIEIVPSNIFEAMVGEQTLSIIFFAILFGLFINYIPKESSTTLNNFFNAVLEVMMKMTMFVIQFTPLGIIGIVSEVIAANKENLVSLAGSLGAYMATVLLALAVHSLITLPLILRYIAKVDLRKHFKAMQTTLLTAFSTASSGAALPLTIQCVEQNAGVSKKISNFVLPLGATVNMDGTALYECVAAIFIAQAYGIELTYTQEIIIVFTSLLASIGAAAIPMAGLVMMAIVLNAVGLPLEGVGLILAVDRILDMFRTMVNTLSDTVGAVVVARLEGEELLISRDKK